MLTIKLFHGRRDPSEELDDWGSEGPLLQIGGFNVTYLATYRVKLRDGDWYEIRFVKDLLFYDGVYYGDFTISDTDPETIGTIVPWFDPLKGQTS